MLTSWENYKIKTGNWEDLRKKISDTHKSEDANDIGRKGSDVCRNLLLYDKYFCNVSLYDSRKEMFVFYVGLQKDTGKSMLEKALEVELESVSDKDLPK